MWWQKRYGLGNNTETVHPTGWGRRTFDFVVAVVAAAAAAAVVFVVVVVVVVSLDASRLRSPLI